MSLVPSTTETLFALGAGPRVVGVTRFCIHPEEARKNARLVGGTKSPDVERILSLEPDLVLANQEENRREDVERIGEQVPVLVLFPKTVQQAIEDLRSLAEIVGARDRARSLAREIASALLSLESAARPFRYLYFIWRRPYMVAGPETFLEALLGEAGGVNVAPRDRGRYPELTLEEIEASAADVLLLSSEPFPFQERHRAELLSALSPRFHERILLVDGEFLSWHGVRLREGIPYLERLRDRFPA